MKAQIFLSCGQDFKSGEKQLAEAIKKRINESDLGFECWAACEVQDLSDLRNIVFKRLENADYFIFVDFKREKLDGKSVHRGSLFANQELAIASYIGLGDCVLLLQEEGVERAGVLNTVLANLKDKETHFSSSDRKVGALPDCIYNLIKTKLEKKEWSNKTRNTLALSAYRTAELVLPRPFHISVENLHHRKDARNCFAYLDEVINLDTNQKVSQKWETVEFKWANTKLASVRIAPKAHRIFDAFWLIPTNTEIEMKFFYAPSSTDYCPHKLRFGRYRLTFSVISDNFAPVRKNFNFDFKSGQSINDASASWINASEQTD